MEGPNVNGGNADEARESPNLDTAEVPEPQEVELAQDIELQSGKMDIQEVNGDIKASPKKSPTPVSRRKLRKFKTNSTSTVESDASLSPRGRKRKLSDPYDPSSDDSTGFSGFDVQGLNEADAASEILKKLIEEAEIAETQLAKRWTYTTFRKTFDTRKDDDDSDDSRMHAYDTEHGTVLDKLKKERESDTESSGLPNDYELESAKDTVKYKSRISHVASPNLGKVKTVDMTNPAFKEPFKYGWKRELVFRATPDSTPKRMADIYYYTPGGKKVRSFREVAEFLNTKELTIDNFTFFKEPLGIDDPEKEIIRDAKKIRGFAPSSGTSPRRGIPYKKAAPARKTVEEPMVASPAPVPVTAPTSTPMAQKAVTKSPKVATPGFKAKTPAKKTPQITEMKSAEENEMLPPQRSTPATRRNQAPVEKPLPPSKPKRVPTPKVQEPCSIRCSTSMGLIPSLQCRVCLCLYHPECVDGMEFAGSDEYVCKNCKQVSSESQQVKPTVTPPTPPPLIPISMLGSQNAKGKQQLSLSPPKLQRIPKSENAETQTRGVTKSGGTSPSNAEKKETSWYPQTENDFMQSPDGTIPKPAQNIALMGGKRYIVVPKNNAMAVQPAITVKPDKIGDKAPLLQDVSLTDISNTVENSNFTQSRVSLLSKSSDKDISEKALMEETSSAHTMGAESSPIKKHQNEHSTGSIRMEASGINKLDSESVNVKSAISLSTKSSKMSHKSPERRSSLNTVSSKLGLSRSSSKRRQNMVEFEHQQHFMDSVCAGYHALLRIFQYLKVQELLRAARVCKMWRDLAAHSSLWKTVRMKNSQVTDWDGLADTLQRHGTQHLDLRKMLVAGESDSIWKKFLSVIPRVTSLVKLELCRCPVMVVEEVIKSCPQLEVLSAMSIKCDSLNLESVGNLKRCQELRLKAISGMSLQTDLTPLKDLTQLTQLSLTSVKELGKKRIDIIQLLGNLEALELGECSDFPDKFGTTVLIKLQKLERLRLEKGQGSCCTFDILEGVSKLQNLSQMELVNFDVKNGFDKCLANCKNIKRLLIIPTYISQSATSNNMVLGGVTELSNNLTHFVWGVTLELLRVTELFVDQCNLMNKQVTGDSIPVLKPVPCLKLIEDVEDENDNQKGDDKQQPNLTNPQVDILPLPQLQKLLLTALPKTRVKILKIPFHATWRQSISDTTTQ